MTARLLTGQLITARSPRISQKQQEQTKFQKGLTFVEIGGKIFAFAELPTANGEWEISIKVFAKGVIILEASGKIKVNEFTAEVDITGLVQVAFYDTDGDGLSNIEEVLAGKDPLKVEIGAKTCPDSDGDGFQDMACGGTDCNDINANIKPSATEICDGIDNDCDSQVDEGVKLVFYQDQDGDGYGNPSSSVQACSAPAGYVSNSADCNDSNANIKPFATEYLNGITDDNCNGVVERVELAPKNLTYFFVSTDTVGLRWQDNSPNENEFVVQVSTNSAFSPILKEVTFPQDTAEGYITGLNSNTVYYFRVYARNSTAQTDYSAVLIARTTPFPYFEGAVQIALGGYHTCAVKTDGSLWCWGSNGSGQIGIRSSYGDYVLIPFRVVSGTSSSSPSPVFRSESGFGDSEDKEFAPYGCSSFNTLFVVLPIVPAYIIRRRVFRSHK